MTVQEKGDGNLRLKFTPKVPGSYSVEVKISGEKLPTCPFTLPVKERQLSVVGEFDLKFNQGQEFKGPTGIAVNTQGDIAVVDNLGNCVFVCNKEGNCLKQSGAVPLEKKVREKDISRLHLTFALTRQNVLLSLNSVTLEFK